MRLFVMVTLVAVMFAGCSESEKPAAKDSFSEDLDQDLKATATTGIIRGVVIDETITPVADASVRLLSQEKETTTDANGAFGFDGLQPGTHFMEIKRFGYGTVQSSADVTAGVETPDIVKVQIARIPGLEPYSETLLFEGFIQCSVAYVINSRAVCQLVPDAVPIQEDKFATRYEELPRVPTFAQSEMQWENTQQLGQHLKVMYTDDSDGLDNFAVDEGESPLRIAADNGTWEEKHFEEVGVLIRVFPSRAQTPAVSVILQQEFEIYSSFFYHYAPPEDWWFLDASTRPAPPG